MDATSIYWVNAKSAGFDLMKAPKGGGCAAVLRADVNAGVQVGDVLIDETDGAVIVGSDDAPRAVVRVDPNTGVDLTVGPCNIAGLGVATQTPAAVVYPCGESSSSVWKIARAAGSTREQVDYDLASPIGSIASDGTSVFWNYVNASIDQYQPGQPTVSLNSNASFRRIVVFGSTVYSTTTTGSVWKSVPGSGSGELDNGYTDLGDLRATQNDSVFVIDRGTGSGDGRVASTATTKDLITGLQKPVGIALDGQYVYVSDQATGVIWRAKRP